MRWINLDDDSPAPEYHPRPVEERHFHCSNCGHTTAGAPPSCTECGFNLREDLKLRGKHQCFYCGDFTLLDSDTSCYHCGLKRHRVADNEILSNWLFKYRNRDKHWCQCGMVTKPDHKHCSACGVDLLPDRKLRLAQQCISCHGPTLSTDNFCIECGNRLISTGTDTEGNTQ